MQYEKNSMTTIIDKTDYRLFYYLSYIIKFRWEELRQKCDNIMTEEYELGSSSYGAPGTSHRFIGAHQNRKYC